MLRTVNYRGSNSGRGPSPEIWADCPVLEILQDPRIGFHYFDDLIDTPVLHGAAGSPVNTGKYATYIDTGNTIQMLNNDKRGVLEHATDATDNDETWMSLGGNQGAMVVIDTPVNGAYKLWAEFGIRVQNIADSQKNIFIGLSQEGRAAADTITDAGVLGDFDFIGFNQPEADGDGVDFIYQKEGQALQVKIADVHTLVANAFVNLGFVYDPKKPESERITVYVNGVAQSTFVTAANIAAAAFPAGEELTFLAGLKNGAAAAHKHQIDFVRLSQLYS